MKQLFYNYKTRSIFIIMAFFSQPILADDIEKDAEQLQDITVQATRVDKSLYEIPASVGYVSKDDIQLGQQQLGLDESPALHR